MNQVPLTAQSLCKHDAYVVQKRLRLASYRPSWLPQATSSYKD